MKFSAISLLVCAVFHSLTATASRVAVGNCLPRLISYNTISAAVAAAPAGSTVFICPGTYPEQLTITSSLTLTGAFPIAISPATVTMPVSPTIDFVPGVGDVASQILVGGTIESPPIVVNIKNLIVDGAGSSSSSAAGISYVFASGKLGQLEVRNQEFAIDLFGSPFDVNTVNIQNSYIHDFTNTGVLADSDGATGFFVNVNRNLVKSNLARVQSGVEYSFADGRASQNTIVVTNGTGLLLENFFSGMTAKENIIEGANVGIQAGGDISATSTIVEDNVLLNNVTGIFVVGIGGGTTLTKNAISQSSNAAIDLDCSGNSTVQSNFIYGTPLGIANVLPTDAIASNRFLNVGTTTTQCQ
jgi:hypothetical protein